MKTINRLLAILVARYNADPTLMGVTLGVFIGALLGAGLAAGLVEVGP